MEAETSLDGNLQENMDTIDIYPNYYTWWKNIKEKNMVARCGITKIYIVKVRKEKREDNMENIYIKIDDYVLLKKFFKDKELVSIEDLIALIDDLNYDYEKRTEEYEDFIEDVRDNYKFIGMKEAVGYDENW